MSVATITLESANGDSVVIAAPDDDYIDRNIILDTSPDGLYDTGFTVRTQSGAFEPGGRIIGESIPIRQMTLPFWLTKATRPRFQRLWGTPGNFHKVKWHYDGPNGRRSLTLKLAKEISYTTEDGFDADIDDVYHAVVSALAVNPNYEAAEDVQSWRNPGNFTVWLAAISGTFTLGYAGALTTVIPYDADAATVQAALEALPTLGPGKVTVTGDPGKWTVLTADDCPGMLTVDGTSLAPISFSITLGTLSFTIEIGGQTTAPISFTASASTIKQAIEQLSNIGSNGVTVTSTFFGFALSFMTGPLNGFLVALFTGRSQAGIHVAKVTGNPNTGWFEVWNPTDQPEWLEWAFDGDPISPSSWQFPDFGFGQERRWGRAVGADSARMIVTPSLQQKLSVMADPFMDTYVNADLSNAAGLFNGVEPLYAVPPYTGTADDPVLVPVVCSGPCGSKATLRQRRFWSAESGLTHDD